MHILKTQKDLKSTTCCYVLKFLEKEEQAKHKTSRREIIKIRTKINKNEIKNIKNQAIKVCYLEKIGKIDKSLANLNKKRGERPNKENQK
jgi:hypothetical protein